MASINFETLTFDNDSISRYCGNLDYVPVGWAAVEIPTDVKPSTRSKIEVGKLFAGRWGFFGYTKKYIVFEDECDATMFVLGDDMDFFK